MQLTPVNFLNGPSPLEPRQTPQQRNGRRRVRLIIATPVALLLGISVLAELAPALPSPIREPLRELRPFSLFRLLPSANRMLNQEEEGRVNILLLGVGGENHEGAQLTDTIIVASMKPQEKKAALLSLPRDMVVPLENGQWRKVNVINSYAEEEQKGSGPEAARRTIEQILSIPIPYVIRVDFQGFEKLINAVGGIDVEVEHRLDDPRYPIQGRETVFPIEDRYEHLVIPKGWQHFDGATALKFTRSRYGLNGEGSDFARSRRQQKVLLALKEKLMSASILLLPRRLEAISELIAANVQTNLSSWELLRLAEIVRDIDPLNLVHRVIDDGPSSPLMPSRTLTGAYILTPKEGSFEEISRIAQTIFDEEALQEAPLRASTRVSVLNGTSIDGLAARVSQKLTTTHFNVTFIGNTPVKEIGQTIVIDRNSGEHEQAREQLKSILGAPVTTLIPEWLSSANAISPKILESNFIVLLGTDQETKPSQ